MCAEDGLIMMGMQYLAMVAIPILKKKDISTHNEKFNNTYVNLRTMQLYTQTIMQLN